MNIVRRTADLRRALAPLRPHARIGFVPTMGALHAGHASLFALAHAECDHVVASIFVNPKQFNDPNDLAAYPRQEDADAELARAHGVDTLFMPPVHEVFPPGHATSMSVGGVAIGLEGANRPGHFDGVVLVCVKLFAMTVPHCAYFGQKDAQQVAVIRQAVRDLDLDLEIRVGPTVRDADGLALSSRNVRLSVEERRRALAIPAALEAGLRAYEHGRDPVTAARAVLGDLDVEYVAIGPFPDGPTLVIAARAGATRLIDNVPLDHPEQAGFGRTATGERTQP
jgi:pantoate--beta-alanine ligase